MRLYYTKAYKRLGYITWAVPGPEIYAVDDQHALLALSIIGYPDLELTYYEEIDPSDKESLVEWDSILYPNKLQLN